MAYYNRYTGKMVYTHEEKQRKLLKTIIENQVKYTRFAQEEAKHRHTEIEGIVSALGHIAKHLGSGTPQSASNRIEAETREKRRALLKPLRKSFTAWEFEHI